jgi:hypothetical protein
MRLMFMLSGSLVAEAESDVVPTVGSRFTIRMASYKKGLAPGTILDVPVLAEFPPVFDYTGNEPVVYLDVDQFHVVQEGPEPSED